MKRKIKMNELHNQMFSYEKYDICERDGYFVLEEKDILKIEIPNIFYCRFSPSDEGEGYPIVERFYEKNEILNMLGIDFHYGEIFSEHGYMFGNFFFDKEGKACFKKADENHVSRHVLVRVKNGVFISKEELKKKGIKFFRRNKQSKTSYFVFPVPEAMLKKHNEIMSQEHKKIEEQYLVDKEKWYNRVNLVRNNKPEVIKYTNIFIDRYKAIFQEKGIDVGEGKTNVIGFDAWYITDNPSMKIHLDFEGKSFKIYSYFNNEYIIEITEDDDTIQSLNEVLQKEKEELNNSLKIEQERVLPLIDYCKENGVKVFSLNSHLISYRDSYYYNFYGDEDDDIHDEWGVEMESNKTEFVTKKLIDSLEYKCRDKVKSKIAHDKLMSAIKSCGWEIEEKDGITKISTKTILDREYSIETRNCLVSEIEETYKRLYPPMEKNWKEAEDVKFRLRVLIETLKSQGLD